MPPRITEIRLLVGTDDDEEVTALAAAVSRLACGEDDFDQHGRRVPWLVISSGLDADAADEVRGLLNR